MDKLNVFKTISKIFLGFVVFIVLLFGGLILFVESPELFIKEKIAAADWEPNKVEEDLEYKILDREVEYGYRLLAESPKYIGPNAEHPEMRYAGNNLACVNCHLKNGTQAGSGSWVGILERFPQYSGRDGKESTIEDRINGCMERSMNGKKLPKDSREMKAMIAYMDYVSEGIPEERKAEFKGYPPIELPDFPADPQVGKDLYSKECAVCHGEDGQGQRLAEAEKGYLYPPLWGDDTFNHGAGMHRVITAAEFIKSNMPFEEATWDNPKLTDEEAYHIAAYINSFDRPQKANTEKDFPDKRLKPVSTPYGPWTDDFSPEQHKYGPFPPIIAYYKEKYDISKSK
ncbi:MAG: c-type cytochrome [Salegentibacter sp.]|uniref:Cytochrome c n=1 Tax=Salegentibacter flavus TaxID=287099 RepID=A0A1I4Z806_9FLAO|nr:MULTISPECIES: c-type cytochrome [Salegentibacter]MDR9456259.1 c-type cytochrome [Salegentibacter sp.]SFN46317.1 Cytochrome c [Salegentibacter flavus]